MDLSRICQFWRAASLDRRWGPLFRRMPLFQLLRGMQRTEVTPDMVAEPPRIQLLLLNPVAVPLVTCMQNPEQALVALLPVEVATQRTPHGGETRKPSRTTPMW